jgi:hypothetical protein
MLSDDDIRFLKALALDPEREVALRKIRRLKTYLDWSCPRLGAYVVRRFEGRRWGVLTIDPPGGHDPYGLNRPGSATFERAADAFDYAERLACRDAAVLRGMG